MVCVKYRDLNGILQQRQPATKRDIVHINSAFKGPLPTLMHCAPRTQIPRISSYEITDSCERVFKRFGIRSNDSGYALQKNCHPFEQHWLSVRNRNFIPSNDYPLEKNCHPFAFERLRLSVGKNCDPFERLELSVQNNCHPRYYSKPLSPELLIATKGAKNVSLYK